MRKSGIELTKNVNHKPKNTQNCICGNKKTKNIAENICEECITTFLTPKNKTDSVWKTASQITSYLYNGRIQGNKSKVNKMLYSLQKKWIIEKRHDGFPYWKLTDAVDHSPPADQFLIFNTAHRSKIQKTVGLFFVFPPVNQSVRTVVIDMNKLSISVSTTLLSKWEQVLKEYSFSLRYQINGSHIVRSITDTIIHYQPILGPQISKLNDIYNWIEDVQNWKGDYPVVPNVIQSGLKLAVRSLPDEQGKYSLIDFAGVRAAPSKTSYSRGMKEEFKHPQAQIWFEESYSAPTAWREHILSPMNLWQPGMVLVSNNIHKNFRMIMFGSSIMRDNSNSYLLKPMYTSTPDIDLKIKPITQIHVSDAVVLMIKGAEITGKTLNPLDAQDYLTLDNKGFITSRPIVGSYPYTIRGGRFISYLFNAINQSPMKSVYVDVALEMLKEQYNKKSLDLETLEILISETYGLIIEEDIIRNYYP